MDFGTVNKNYVSSIALLDQREILKQIIDVTNEEPSFLDVMELMGRVKETAVPSYHYFKNQELFGFETVGTVVGSGTTTVTAPITGKNNGASLLRKGALVMLPNKQRAMVRDKTAGTPDTVVLKPLDGVTNLTLTAGDKITMFSQVGAEGGEGPDPIRTSLEKHHNIVMIIEESYDITDIALTSKIEAEFQGKPFIFYKGQHDAFTRFQAYMSNALIWSEISDENFAASNPTLTDLENRPIQTTRGLDQYALSYGVTRTGTAGGWTIADSQAIIRSLQSRRAPKEYLWFVPLEGNIQLDNHLNNLGNSTATAISTSGRLSLDGREIDLGVDKFKMYGYQFAKRALDLFDHQQLSNFTGSAGFERVGYMLPLGKIKVHGSNDMVDRFCIRYLPQVESFNPRYHEIHTGGLAPTPTSKVRKWEITYTGIMGFEAMGPEHLGRTIFSA